MSFPIFKLNEPIKSWLHEGKFNCSLRDIMNYALLLYGSPFTVGEAEDFKAQETVHKMAAAPESRPVPS